MYVASHIALVVSLWKCPRTGLAAGATFATTRDRGTVRERTLRHSDARYVRRKLNFANNAGRKQHHREKHRVNEPLTHVYERINGTQMRLSRLTENVTSHPEAFSNWKWQN